VGAPWQPSSPRFGRVHIYDGSSGILRATIASPNPVTKGFFGQAVSRIPDLTGDTYDDLAIGAPGEDGAHSSQGRAYLYSRPIGAGVPQLLVTLDSPHPAVVGHFGEAIQGIEDVNGDGVGDVVVGAPGEDGGRIGSGRAYVFSGSSGQLLHALVSAAPETQGHFGTEVAAVPDVDGDGIMDVLIAEPQDIVAFPLGFVYLFSGATGALILSLDGTQQGAFAQGFGATVAGLEDLDGDGRGELLVGSPSKAGWVRLFSGATGSLLHTFHGDTSQGQGLFGASIASAGDADGDGVEDIMIGAPGEFDEGAGNGRVYVFSGAGFGLLSKLEAPDLSPGGIPMSFNHFGEAVGSMPDADGDGLPEYLVGASGLDLGAFGTGSMYAFFCTTEVEATMLERLGVPPNPSVFSATSTPVIGSFWTVSIDHITFQPAATLDLYLLSATAINVPSTLGTLLVPLTPATTVSVLPAGFPYSFSIPGDCSLVGVQATMQGISFDGVDFAGANALDIRLGSF
jgi:hypothetical protein